MNVDKKFTSLLSLTKYFSNEKKCVKYLEQSRWNGTIACPHCGSVKIYVCKGLGKYTCGEKGCLKRFSVTTGTFLENTKIPLSKWFVAMYLCLSHRKGVSSHQLARDLDISQKSAWFLLHRIRAFVKQQRAGFVNPVEVDECYIGGKNKNRHKNKRRPTHDKQTILGMVERGGKVVARHIPEPLQHLIEPFIFAHVQAGTKVYTDEHYAYKDLNKFYDHETINHSSKVYVVGKIHTNTIENFWSFTKWALVGSYKQVSDKHIQRYLDEITYRYSTRKSNEQQRFNGALVQCHGRLKWNDLTAKK